MARFAILLWFCLASLELHAQSSNEIKPTLQEEEVFASDAVDDLPHFGHSANVMFKHIANALRYPVEATRKGIEGTVKVSCVVRADSTLTRVVVLEGIGGGCDAEAVRMVKEMPPRVPGFKEGRPVAVCLVVPITFTLTKQEVEVPPKQVPLPDGQHKGGKG